MTEMDDAMFGTSQTGVPVFEGFTWICPCGQKNTFGPHDEMICCNPKCRMKWKYGGADFTHFAEKLRRHAALEG